jgi:hypothetical protein
MYAVCKYRLKIGSIVIISSLHTTWATSALCTVLQAFNYTLSLKRSLLLTTKL